MGACVVKKSVLRVDSLDMLVPSIRRFGWAVVALLSGCFAELASESSTNDSSSAQSCEAGALGCECYGNGSCDPTLECVAEISMCVPADCTAGSAGCVCDQADCEAGSVCTDGLCVAMADTSTGSDNGSGGTTADMQTESTGDEPDGSSTGDDPGSSTGNTNASAESSDDAETGSVACDAQSCGVCVGCVAEPAGDCSVAAQQCDQEPGCAAAAVCLVSCGAKGLCLDACCDGISGAAAAAAVMLNGCRADQCAAACVDYNIGQCL